MKVTQKLLYALCWTMILLAQNIFAQFPAHAGANGFCGVDACPQRGTREARASIPVFAPSKRGAEDSSRL